MLTMQCESLKWTQTQRKSEPCSSFLLYFSDIHIQILDEGGKKETGPGFFSTERQTGRIRGYVLLWA